MRLFNDECKVCGSYEKRIEDLKIQIERLVKEKENERAEYKRAIDVLLQQKQMPIIGQGVPQAQAPMDVKALLGFMEEEVKPNPDGNQRRA